MGIQPLEMLADSRRTDGSRETAALHTAPVPLSAVYPQAATPSEARRGWVARMISGIRGYVHRRSAADLFRWNVPAEHIGVVRPETVYCVDLPVSDPVGMLASYIQSGVKSSHVVFVGNPLTMTDDAYNRITQQGALVYAPKKRSPHQQTQQELSPRFVPAPVVVRPKVNPNRYSYDPGVPAATHEQVEAIIDAIAKK